MASFQEQYDEAMLAFSMGDFDTAIAGFKAILAADPTHPTGKPVPYTGVQFVAIPEFQSLGTQVGQNIASALVGKTSVEGALETSQTIAERTMRRAGYTKK